MGQTRHISPPEPAARTEGVIQPDGDVSLRDEGIIQGDGDPRAGKPPTLSPASLAEKAGRGNQAVTDSVPGAPDYANQKFVRDTTDWSKDVVAPPITREPSALIRGFGDSEGCEKAGYRTAFGTT